MDKIDLDLIASNEAKKFRTGSLKETDTMALYLRNVMMETARQSLILASKKAKVKMVAPKLSEVQKSMDSFFMRKTVKPVVDKQSILDVEKLIV